jgi:hypothetical protein
MTAQKAEPLGMNLNDRAAMLRSIAEHWTETIYLYERGRSPVLYEHMIHDLLLTAVQRYAHPMSREDLTLYVTDLVKAVHDLESWECYGILPDSFDEDEAYAGRDSDAILARLNADIDEALAPLIYGVTAVEMCQRCRRLNSTVTSWQRKTNGTLFCSDCQNERAASLMGVK